MKKIYCDAGKPGSANNTNPTRIRVCDETGKDLLGRLANDTYNGNAVFCFPDNHTTNNFGELVAITIAMRIAVETRTMVVCTDSNVVTWWVQGKGKALKDSSYGEYYRMRTKPHYEAFVRMGGKVEWIPGSENIADLGDHK